MSVVGESRVWLVEELLPVARAAGEAILEVYATDFDVRYKHDSSPVTIADEHAETVILERLAVISPEVPTVSEEAAAEGHIPEVGDRFWLVDPLDGTREFINRNGEFTVNIGLIEDHRPVLGVVFAPALGRLFAGAVGSGAFLEDESGRRPITCRAVPPEGLTVVSSRSHADSDSLERFLSGRKVAAQVSSGSSLKLCLIATGEADLYPRLGRTMEWDIAAGHGVLRAAGGRLTDLDGNDLLYGKPGFENPHFIAAAQT